VEQPLQRFHRAGCGSGLGGENFVRAFAHLGCLLRLAEKSGDGFPQLLGCGDFQCVPIQEGVDDGAEVGEVGTYYDWDGELRWFEGIVAAGGDEAAADDGDRGDRID
jgi:hypothetical protein